MCKLFKFYENGGIVNAEWIKVSQLKVGDEVDILFTHDEHARSRKITLDSTTVIIGGIFTTGIDEMDAGLVICSFALFDSLFPDAGITHINIKLAPNANPTRLRTAMSGPTISRAK